MLIVGLTGGIATGKSKATEMFRKRGAVIVDYDVMAREVVEPDTPAWNDIVDHFGESILMNDRTLDRARIGEIVFANPEERKRLEGFIYPRLFNLYAQRIKEIEGNDPNALVIVDTPLLFEANLQGMSEKIIVVYAPRKQQMARLAERDGFDAEAVVQRLDAQMPIEKKVKLADYVIDNSGSIEEMEGRVDEIYSELMKLSEKKQNPHP